jgi:toxin ParE1/3/4
LPNGVHVLADYGLTQQADAQLFEILRYSLTHFGEGQAQKYHDELLWCFQMLADNPQLGRSAERARPATRRHEHKQHVILYRATDTGVMILAIFDMRSNWQLPVSDD